MVKELPRGALVEKQTLLHTGRVLQALEDEDDEITWTNKEPFWHSGRLQLRKNHSKIFTSGRFQPGVTVIPKIHTP